VNLKKIRIEGYDRKSNMSFISMSVRKFMVFPNITQKKWENQWKLGKSTNYFDLP